MIEQKTATSKEEAEKLHAGGWKLKSCRGTSADHPSEWFFQREVVDPPSPGASAAALPNNDSAGKAGEEE